MLKSASLLLALTLSMGCVRLAPEATAPNVCRDCKWWPSNAWLTLEKDREIVGWIEVEGFPSNAFDVRFSEDHVAEVVGIKEPLLSSIYRDYRKLFAEHGMRFSKRGFKRAMRRGQLTCHFGSTFWPSGDYSTPAGRWCVNNLLFSLPPPEDPDQVLASLDIWLDSDEEAASAVASTMAVQPGPPSGRPAASDAPPAIPPEGQVRSRTPPWGPDGQFQEDLAGAGSSRAPAGLDTPRVAPWTTVLGIMQAATRFDEAVRDEGQVSFGKETCLRNLPPGMIAEDPQLTGAVVTAFVQYSSAPAGRALIVKHALQGDPAGLWQDPCLPGQLEDFLKAENVYLLRNADLQATETACRARGAD